MPDTSARTGRPPKISRAEIVAAAESIIDAEGVDKLTMRRVAAELGCTAMALYHHVRDKDDLLRLVLDDYADRVQWPALPDDPRERIIVAATAMHEVLSARPWIVEVLTRGDLFGISALWVAETIVDAACAYGLAPADAVGVYRTIWHYTAGEIIVRTGSARRAAEGRPTFREQVFADLDPDVYPRLAEWGPRFVTLPDSTYATGLPALVDGLLHRAGDR
ncbi:TetR family transcriptional regulator [Nocardia farcinica]|uniref:TetR/AcrR family transcriptional regulator n=1 Tax=Nocardia TaxID=1817 RepID=UPI000BF11CC8|nr:MULTISPECIES: TetR/AcrR family transcriptional regulator [Nocardia]MBF6139262.1 TetR family transcriptional regulator [Nocardia farcinica]MBF6183835.1 TetR family transcriptional regulator [Nocardia farcinica]MBF6257461.1 TetR family transcriptional regulator [Nocardia farcinica]MBF6260467.1 TetR family transcriptional regulator [Nocardia farcinica]MBF6279863.1 TetR family transcriptional regulator [Nocardia farcinica]